MRGTGKGQGDGNVVSEKFLGDRVRETIQSPLGSSVRGAIRQGVLPGDGRNIDDGPAAGGNHHRSELAQGVKNSAHIGVHYCVHVVCLHYVKRTATTGGSSVVDTNV